jgi:hypothetical protein
LEHDITGAQTIGFKIFKKVKMEENDRLKLNLIPKTPGKKHYAELWKTETTTEENTEGAEDDKIDEKQKKLAKKN